MRLPWRAWALWFLTAGIAVNAGFQEDNSKVRKIPVSIRIERIDCVQLKLIISSYVRIVYPQSVHPRFQSLSSWPVQDQDGTLILHGTISRICIQICKTGTLILEETR